MMLVVVDANTWGIVFPEEEAVRHGFEFLRECFMAGRCVVVWGGTKYLDELRKAPRYLSLHVEFQKMGRARRFSDDCVDACQRSVERLVKHRNFDDPHIVAIQIVSKADLICSCDKRAYQFYKMSALYPKRHARPKLYTGKKNDDLLRCGELRRKRRSGRGSK